MTLSFTANILINSVLPAFGIDVRGVFSQQLLVWSLVIGFGGAFISLAFSKQMARAMLDCQQITQPRSHAEQMIYGSVQEIAQRLGITMPEVWVYNSPDPNAFATGPSKNNSMVAVSTGLLQNLKEDEVKAVLAHEMGHVYNGDMFTTTVLAGLMNDLYGTGTGASNPSPRPSASGKTQPEPPQPPKPPEDDDEIDVMKWLSGE